MPRESRNRTVTSNPRWYACPYPSLVISARWLLPVNVLPDVAGHVRGRNAEHGGDPPSEILSGDAELAHQGIQCRPWHSETRSSLADHAARFPKDADDMLTVHLLERTAA